MSNKTVYIFSLLCCFFLIKTSIVDAKNDKFEQLIYEINDIFEQIRATRNDDRKKFLGKKIEFKLGEILEDDSSFEYDFSKLTYINVLESDDGNLRIYNWNIAFQAGGFKYYGYLQHSRGRNNIDVFKLNDLSEHYGEEGRNFNSHIEWFGVLYYEIITKRWNRETYYTLIGYDPANFLINRKVVEVLSFSRRGLPQFGRNMFVYNNSRTGRLIFEYADRATMLLRYNSKQDIIVIDHLSPSEPKYRGLPQYYGPDLSYDALRFIGGRWIHESDIDPDIAINYQRDRRINHMKRQRRARMNQ